MFLNIETNVVESKMTLTSQKWDDQLRTKASEMYKNLEMQLIIEVIMEQSCSENVKLCSQGIYLFLIRKIHKEHTSFSYVIIKGFR